MRVYKYRYNKLIYLLIKDKTFVFGDFVYYGYAKEAFMFTPNDVDRADLLDEDI